MKHRIFVILGLALLLALIAFMVKDLFLGKSEYKNPYAYDLEKIRKSDSSAVQFTEGKSFKPLLAEIHGIAVGAEDEVYVCGKDGVEIYDKDGALQSRFGIRGVATCIGVGNAKSILLGMTDHIEKFDSKGNLLSEWVPASSESVLTSIAVSGTSVFVADAGAKIVYRYDNAGKLQNKIGQKDPQAGVKGFIIPSPYFDLAIADANHIWVVNPGRHNFEKYTFDGEIVTVWGKASMAVDGFCGCCNPSNFAILPDSSFVTSEKAIERVKIYSPKGDYVCLVATPDSFTAGTKGLDLAVNSKGEILLLDPARGEIRKFAKKEHRKQ
jgi:hypothetical protein